MCKRTPNLRFAAQLLAGVALLVLGPVLSAQTADGKRVALLIGNDAYSIAPLKNAVNDARLMAKSLQAAGFRIILRENAGKAAMEQAAADFLSAIGPGDTALFFYAGHAVQIENENVLIPVDFEAASTVIEARFKSFSLSMVFDYLKRARAKRSILIIDACRSNPVADGQSLQAGLAMPLNAGRETYTAFSTSPNHVATDNPDGSNSWFTEALAGLIVEPGLTLDEVFTKVRSRAEKATTGKQTPWSQTSLTSRFYFMQPDTLEAENDPAMTDRWMQEAVKQELRGNWDAAIETVKLVIGQKPGGMLQFNAERKLPYLTARREAAAKREAGDFAGAATLLQQAFKLDPFATEAAVQAVSALLLSDQLNEALPLLKALRIRGDSGTVQKSDAILKELAAVLPEAAAELKAGPQQPPPIQELFSAMRIGVPDWGAATRYTQSARFDIARWLKELTPPEPVVVEVSGIAPAGAAPAEVTADVFHVELTAQLAHRNLAIRRVESAQVNTGNVQRPSGLPVKVTTEPAGADLSVEGDADQRCQSPCVLLLPKAGTTVRARLDGFREETRAVEVGSGGQTVHIPLEQEFGFLELSGNQPQAVVSVNGQAVSRQVPVILKLPAGKYEWKTSGKGSTGGTRAVEVKASSTVQLNLAQ